MNTVYRGPTRRVEEIQRLVSVKLHAWIREVRVLIAVSGGQDSICLLHAVLKASTDLGLDPVVGHVDHQLSPSSTDAASSVEVFCRSLGLTYIRRSVDVRHQIRPGEESEEMAARRLRHAALQEMKRQSGSANILLGHTADDQAETVLMRAVRGTGIAGLAGMAPIAGDIIRPLLGVWRAETAEYCRSLSLPVISDPSNTNPAIVRNQLRDVVIPTLEERYPGTRRNLVQLAVTAGRDRQFLERMAREALGAITVEGHIQAALWAALPSGIGFHALRLHSAQTSGYPQNALALEEMAATLRSAAWQSGITAPNSVRGAAGIPLLSSDTSRLPSHFRIPARTVVDDLEFDATILDPNCDVQARLAVTSYWDAYLDGAIGRDLAVRTWLPGDRMRPLGAPGSRKLQDIFVDRRIPRSLRGRVPVVTARGLIVWVPGVALAHRARVTEDSNGVLHVRVRTITSGSSVAE